VGIFNRLYTLKKPKFHWEFVALVEDEFADVPEENVSMWLSKLIGTDDRLTPSGTKQKNIIDK